MCFKTFQNAQNDMLHILRDLCFDNMKKAAEEEKAYALRKNQVQEANGEKIPWIAVVTDGGWMTRSYGTNLSSLSGLAVIIGLHTGKVLWIGTKNKYCAKCDSEEKFGLEKNHDCFKDYDINAPSTGMETQIILEGFQKSVEMYGLIYKILVSDGDSDVYTAIVNSKVYEKYNVIPIRIRCYNHLQRNLYKHLDKIAKAAAPKQSPYKKEYISLRKILEGKIQTFRDTISECIERRKMQTGEWASKVQDLREDILYLPNHIFGDHENCNGRAYGCL